MISISSSFMVHVCTDFLINNLVLLRHVNVNFVCAGERLGRGIVTDAITTPVVNTSAYFFKKTAELIDFKVCKVH